MPYAALAQALNVVGSRPQKKSSEDKPSSSRASSPQANVITEPENVTTENEITESANVTTEHRKESGKPSLPHAQRLLPPA